jgi:fructokinase
LSRINCLWPASSWGGTKGICTLAFGPGLVIEQATVETTDPDETLGSLKTILRGWWSRRGFRALGIASFGPIRLDPVESDYGHILSTNKPGWSGVDVLGELSRDFPVPCGFDTDVNAAAFAEIAGLPTLPMSPLARGLASA